MVFWYCINKHILIKWSKQYLIYKYIKKDNLKKNVKIQSITTKDWHVLIFCFVDFKKIIGLFQR